VDKHAVFDGHGRSVLYACLMPLPFCWKSKAYSTFGAPVAICDTGEMPARYRELCTRGRPGSEDHAVVGENGC